ncbi:DUF4097 family beta strand repeat-containing protein [Krasilnikovia sp. MM14-A1259]|uniref:DUF4097 family beta strand repeat-containing protein n=1 Tax=Krasilnikovia sp. MM14-A1259 TaxID=3373539 RepID=UPI0038245860
MPQYETPGPISVTLELGVGDVRIVAGDRTDTIVEVRPSDDANEFDVKAAQQIRVDYNDGVLRVTGPKARPFDYARNRLKSADVTIELPGGSQISAEMQMGDIRSAGPLGACRLKTSGGNVQLDRTGPLRLSTSAGHVTVAAVAGNAEISTGTGRVEVGEVEGTAVVKNSNGDTTIGAVTDDVRVRAANGDIQVERAGAGVDAKSSNGSIRLGRVARGSIVVGTAMGDLDIGIAEGTAAWLEVNTAFGQVRNLMDDITRPDETDQTVEVRGRTSYGDITVHRS